jgi:hypothetical protein
MGGEEGTAAGWLPPTAVQKELLSLQERSQRADQLNIYFHRDYIK